MKSRLKIPYKWAIFICLLIIPYYIHAARIDRILNNYTQKSNAIFIILQEQVSKKLNTLAKLKTYLYIQTFLLPPSANLQWNYNLKLNLIL